MKTITGKQLESNWQQVNQKDTGKQLESNWKGTENGKKPEMYEY